MTAKEKIGEKAEEKMFLCETPEDTFDLGEKIGESLHGAR
jgi:hypothetical protein